ncbi:hypothetical protein [Nonlabens tegetincola]|uniref:hypothetical protein n=1 Tax=Nonlabens tegetincola TaxID=323273 RepID=UPI0026BBA8B0
MVLQEIWKQEEEETLSIITYGMGVHWAMNATQELGVQDRVEVVDLRTYIRWTIRPYLPV